MIYTLMYPLYLQANPDIRGYISNSGHPSIKLIGLSILSTVNTVSQCQC